MNIKNIYIQINYFKNMYNFFIIPTNIKHKTSNYSFVPKRYTYLKNITKI